jgi:hypothetical protein
MTRSNPEEPSMVRKIEIRTTGTPAVLRVVETEV